VPAARAWLFALLATGACGLKVDARAGRFSCTDVRDCPLGSVCQDQLCVVEEPPPCGSYAEAVLADEPVRYYRLDETGGTQLADSAPLGQDALALDDVTLGVPGGLTGDASTAISVHGPTWGMVRFEGVTWEGDFTVELLVRPIELVSGTGGLVVVGSYENDGFRLSIRDDRLTAYCSSNGCTDPEAVGPLVTTGSWRHVALSREGDSFTVYLDGERVASQDMPSFVTPATGGFFGPAQALEIVADLDELAVYEHALPAERVAIHAEIMKRGATPCP
jgi:hypothetical protein